MISFQIGIPALHNFFTHFVNAKDYITGKQPSTYVQSTCKPSKISSILSAQRRKKLINTKPSQNMFPISLKPKWKWAQPSKFILWPDAFNLIQLTYWSFSCYCNCFQKNLNNASTNSWWIPLADIKVSKDFLYYVMGILCLLKKQTENLHLWL